MKANLNVSLLLKLSNITLLPYNHEPILYRRANEPYQSFNLKDQIRKGEKRLFVYPFQLFVYFIFIYRLKCLHL